MESGIVCTAVKLAKLAKGVAQQQVDPRAAREEHPADGDADRDDVGWRERGTRLADHKGEQSNQTNAQPRDRVEINQVDDGLPDHLSSAAQNAGEITTLLVYNILFILFTPATYYTIRLAYTILFLTPSDLCTSLNFHGSRLLIPHYFSKPLFFLLFTRLLLTPLYFFHLLIFLHPSASYPCSYSYTPLLLTPALTLTPHHFSR